MIPLDHFQGKRLSFRLEPSTILDETRFVVIIGPNGAGKSRLLGELADAAAEAHRETAHHSNSAPTLAVSNLITDPFTRSRTSKSEFRYLGVRTLAGNSTSTGSVRSLTIDAILACMRESWRIEAVNEAFRIAGFEDFGIRAKPLAERREDAVLSAPLTRIDEPDARDLVKVLRQMGEQALPKGYGAVDWTTFLDRAKELLGGYGFSGEESVSLAWRYALPRPDLTVRIGRDIHDISVLSVGQMLLVSMVARIAANVERGSLVLIDEPEVGLHPTWQSEVVPLLRKAIPAKIGAQVFLATHSPHLVADADQVLVPGDEWGVFKEFLGGTAGRSIENLLYRVFEARVTGNRMVEDDLARITKFIAGTERKEIEEADRAFERLRNVAAADTPTVNSLLRSYEDLRGNSSA